jgi:acyl carrier protein
MSREKNLEEIAEIFGEVVDLTGIQFTRDLILGDQLMVSSSEALQIVSRVQTRFGVRFEPMEIIGIKTVGDIVDLVDKHGG